MGLDDLLWEVFSDTGWGEGCAFSSAVLPLTLSPREGT